MSEERSISVFGTVIVSGGTRRHLRLYVDDSGRLGIKNLYSGETYLLVTPTVPTFAPWLSKKELDAVECTRFTGGQPIHQFTDPKTGKACMSIGPPPRPDIWRAYGIFNEPIDLVKQMLSQAQVQQVTITIPFDRVQITPVL